MAVVRLYELLVFLTILQKSWTLVFIAATIVQARQRVLPYFPHRFWLVMIATAVFSAAIAAILACFMARH
ncbi:MAG: hypothetical protein ABSA05_11130 [Opitutaceae bacterium]|jgi:hypothetical protein